MRARSLETVWVIVVLSSMLGCSSTDPNPDPEPELPSASFRGVGDLSGGLIHSEVLGISDDGRVVIGRSSSSRFDEEGFLLTPGSPLIPLTGSGGTPVSSEPRGITPSGDVIAGKTVVGGLLEAARWTASTGWVGLGDLDGGDTASQALGISTDGAVVVGWGASNDGYEAARWVNGESIAMGDLPGGAYNSAAALASNDGGVIVGTGYSSQGAEVFVWRENTGMTGLGDLPGGDVSSEPFGMTPDASCIVGEASSADGIQAFRWTEGSGMQGLGDLPGGDFSSIAFDVSGDGGTVVGFGNTPDGQEAFVWNAAEGMRRLEDVLVAAGLEEVEPWQLTEATGISGDGKTIVGNGTNPNGETEGWIAQLP